ncbi:MAG: SDR family oxidoreductase [Pseudomonadota bacterium]
MKQVALITGASSGIGRELARIHAEAGGDVVAVATNAGRLEALKRELQDEFGVTVMAVVKDLTKAGAASELHQEIREAGVDVEVLINNAGFGGQGKFHERDWQSDLDMINLNVVALTELTRRFLPDLVARGSGRILNVSSTASLVPGPLQAVYYATKAFVTSFSNAISSELQGTDVTVTNLMPGATETGFAKTSGMEKTDLFASMVSARSVAADGYAGLLRGDLDVISGLSFSQRVMVSLARILPKRIVMDQIRKGQEIRAG